MSQLIVPPIKTSKFILFGAKKIRKSQSLSEFIRELKVYREFNYIGVASKVVCHFPKGNIESKHWLCGKAVSKLLLVINPTYAQYKDVSGDADEVRFVYTAPAAVATEDKCVLIPSLTIVTTVDVSARKITTSIKANFATFSDSEVSMVELALDELSKLKHKEDKQND